MPEIPEPGTKSGGTKRPPAPPRLTLFWWVLSLAVFTFYVISLWPRPQPEAQIPYSVFLAEVRSDNVSHVRIAVDAIDGDFLKPLVWPPPEARLPRPLHRQHLLRLRPTQKFLRQNRTQNSTP